MRRQTLTKEERYQRQKDYINNYIKTKTFVLKIGLNRVKDADLIEWLEKIPNGSKRDYIRQLIREDMKKSN